MFDSEVGDTVPGGPRPAASGRLPDGRLAVLVTCVVTYTIDQTKMAEFECFAKRWMELVDAHGGTRRGNFLPAEGASDTALAQLDITSLAAPEEYRQLSGAHPDSSQPTRSATTASCDMRLRAAATDARGEAHRAGILGRRGALTMRVEVDDPCRRCCRGSAA